MKKSLIKDYLQSCGWTLGAKSDEHLELMNMWEQLALLSLNGGGREGVASGTWSGKLWGKDPWHQMQLMRSSGKYPNLTLFLLFEFPPSASNWPDLTWETWGQGSLLIKYMQVSLLEHRTSVDLEKQTESSQHHGYSVFPSLMRDLFKSTSSTL